MNIYDAAKILELHGEVSPEITLAAFRAAAKKYHPNINPAGLEMMKAVNAAFDALRNYVGNVTGRDNTEQNYSEALNGALNAVFNLSGINIEICGAWVWVSGDTRTHKEALKAAGYRWAPKKKQWYFRPEGFRSHSRREHSMEEIRNKYGSTKPGVSARPAISNYA